MKILTSVKTIFWLWVLTAVLVALAGCTPTPAGPATDQTPPGGEETVTEAVGTTPELPITGANTVEVQLQEYTISMPASISAGQTVFEVTNVGTEEHSFVIEGQGIDAELEHHLQPGETLTLEVDLAEGSYEVHCPVEDHAEEGMRLDLTVTAP
jgi:hypothetical protein